MSQNSNNLLEKEKEEEEESEEKESSSEEESSNIEVHQILIKKEECKFIKIDIKLYKRLLELLKNNISLKQNIKKEKFKINFSKETQTEFDDNYLNNIINDNKKTIKKLEEELNTIKIKNKILTNENELLKTENYNLKNEINSIKKKNKEKIDKLNYIILSNKNSYQKLTEEKKLLEEKIKHMKPISLYEEVFKSEKNVNTILSYLTNDYKLLFSSLNQNFHNNFYYNIKFKLCKKKLENTEKILSSLSTENISDKYEIEIEELNKLIEKYTKSHQFIGNNLRYYVIHSLLFLEEFLRKPLREFGAKEEDLKNKNYMNKIKKGFFSVFKSETIDYIMNKKNIINELNNNVIVFPNEKINDLNENDKYLLQLYNDDIFRNIKIFFDFSNSDEIINLIKYFNTKNFSDNNQTKEQFNKNLIIEYSNLLFIAFKTIKELKEIEIVNNLLDSRFKNYKISIQEMQYKLDELYSLYKGSQSVKEIVFKEKRELEIKYNDNLLKTLKLEKKFENLYKEYEIIEKEKLKSEKEYNNYKDKILNEFKKVEENLKFTKNEREILKNILLEFQKYFMNFVDDNGNIKE